MAYLPDELFIMVSLLRNNWALVAVLLNESLSVGNNTSFLMPLLLSNTKNTNKGEQCFYLYVIYECIILCFLFVLLIMHFILIQYVNTIMGYYLLMFCLYMIPPLGLLFQTASTNLGTMVMMTEA